MERIHLGKVKKWVILALTILGIVALITFLIQLWFLRSLFDGDYKGCAGYAIMLFSIYLSHHQLKSIECKGQRKCAIVKGWINHLMDAAKFIFILSAAIIILIKKTLELFFGLSSMVVLITVAIFFIRRVIINKKPQLKTEFKHHNECKELLFVDTHPSTNNNFKNIGKRRKITIKSKTL